MSHSSETPSKQTVYEAQDQLFRQAPELHITAERGVLEAASGAAFADGAIHVFHQFRTKATNGSRWAHVTASHIPYDWDVNDDVLRPEGDEIDVLAGSALTLPETDDEPEHVELIFVTSSARKGAEVTDAEQRYALLGSHIPHGERGERSFQIQRALIKDLASMIEISDDPKVVDPNVKRLGPIDIDDSDHPIADLVTPSVITSSDDWVMMALNLVNDEDAEIVLLTSTDRQHWHAKGALTINSATPLPGNRPFAPRLARMTDTEDDKEYHVLFVTYPADGQWNSTTGEVTGYIVGHLNGTEFTATTEFRPLDYGHDLTRPRMVHGDSTVLFGLVGAHPDQDSDADWANCLSTPRVLTLHGGTLYQDIVGAPQAVHSFSDYGLIWTGQLDADQGEVKLSVRNREDTELLEVRYTRNEVSVTRDGDTRTAPLADADSDTLTVFVDGPLCEVFADGGATTLTSSISARQPVREIQVTATGGAEVKMAMVTQGQQLQREHAGLNTAESQEQLIADSAQADRDIAEGMIDDLLDI